jgi:hypothetical protein
MGTQSAYTRRGFLLANGLMLASASGFAPDTKENLPVVSKRVEKAFRAPCKAPNDLQDAADGLWVLDQLDLNKVFKVSYSDGSVIHEIQTESIHGSGITFGNGAMWIASTWALKTLKVDPPFRRNARFLRRTWRGHAQVWHAHPAVRSPWTQMG